MRRKKQIIQFYRDLPERLKPLGVILGISTIEDIKTSIQRST